MKKKHDVLQSNRADCIPQFDATVREDWLHTSTNKHDCKSHMGRR